MAQHQHDETRLRTRTSFAHARCVRACAGPSKKSTKQCYTYLADGEPSVHLDAWRLALAIEPAHRAASARLARDRRQRLSRSVTAGAPPLDDAAGDQISDNVVTPALSTAD